MDPLKGCFQSHADTEEFGKLQKAYATSGIGLFTGLGVSYGSGLPGWETLTRRVISKIDGGDRIYDDLKARGYTLPAMLTWAGEKLRARFTETLREALYGEGDFDRKLWMVDSERWDDTARREFRDAVRAKNPTLAAVGALTAHVDDGKYSPNDRVKAVLTTNVDTLLRHYTSRSFGTHILRSVERASASPVPGRTNIYYLHGMLRYDAKKDDPTKEAADKLIFTDLHYHSAYREVSAIFTYAPLYLFREYPFLFIGAGMTDDNVRRLLYWSKAEIMRAENEEGEPSAGGQRMHFALLQAPETGAIRDAIQDILRPVRVSPIWYADHKHVPRLLRALYNDDDRWRQLFGPTSTEK